MFSRYFFRQTPVAMKSAYRSYSLSPEQRKKMGDYAIFGLTGTASVVVLIAVGIIIKELTGYGHSSRKKQVSPNVDCQLLLQTYLACTKKTAAYREVEGAELKKPPAP